MKTQVVRMDKIIDPVYIDCLQETSFKYSFNLCICTSVCVSVCMHVCMHMYVRGCLWEDDEGFSTGRAGVYTQLWDTNVGASNSTWVLWKKGEFSSATETHSTNLQVKRRWRADRRAVAAVPVWVSLIWKSNIWNVSNSETFWTPGSFQPQILDSKKWSPITVEDLNTPPSKLRRQKQKLSKGLDEFP